MKKTVSTLGIEGNLLKLIKNIYKNSAADIILNGKKLIAFPMLWSEYLCPPQNSYVEILLPQ